MLGKKKRKNPNKQRKRFISKDTKLPKRRDKSISIIMTGQQALLIEEACAKYRYMFESYKKRGRLATEAKASVNTATSLMNIIRGTLVEYAMVTIGSNVTSRYGVIKLEINEKYARLLNDALDFVVSHNIIASPQLTNVKDRVYNLIQGLDRKAV